MKTLGEPGRPNRFGRGAVIGKKKAVQGAQWIRIRLRVFMARLFAAISQAAGCILGFQVRFADHLGEFLAEEPVQNTRISAGGRGISSGVHARFF